MMTPRGLLQPEVELQEYINPRFKQYREECSDREERREGDVAPATEFLLEEQHAHEEGAENIGNEEARQHHAEALCPASLG